MRGTIVAEDGAAWARDSASGRRITVLIDENGTEPRPLAVVMPSALNGVASGWMLLAMF